MVKNNDFSQYSPQELGTYFVYGFEEEGINYIENFERVKGEIKKYVKTKQKKFREEFRKSVYSELEAMVAKEDDEEPRLDDETESDRRNLFTGINYF